jgi:hypothetical protein
MAELPKIVRDRLQSSDEAVPHPDADLLTAFAENSLGARERQPVLAHLAHCGECREVVMLAQPALALAEVAVAGVGASRAAIPAPLPAAASMGTSSGWPRRLIFGWGGAAAACVVIASAALFYQTRVREKAAVASARNAQVEGLTADRDSNIQPPPEAAASAPVPPRPQDQLTARLERPAQAKAIARQSAPPERRKETALGGFAGAPALKPKIPAVDEGAGVINGAADGAAPPSNRNSQIADKVQVEVSGAEGPVTVEPNQQTNLPLNGRSVATVQNEQVEVAAAPSPQAEQKTATASAPKPVAGVLSPTGLASEKKSAEVARMQSLRQQGYEQVASNYIPARWSISSDGSTLLRSSDQGRSWEVVRVASRVVFRVVASLGIEVWAAGNSGALYHSVDLGQHWAKVAPVANGNSLNTDIVSIDLNDSLRIQLTTSDGKSWTTTDGGKSWQVQ